MLLDEVPAHIEVFIDSNIFESRELRRRYLLMTKDSLNLHVMRSNQLYDIATNDGDFERVEWVNAWKP